MTRPYQNIAGVLSWIASRDAEASNDLNEFFRSATDQVERIVAALYLGEFASPAGLLKAKAELVSACEDGRLTGFGYTADNEELRPIAETAWIGATLDEVDGCIAKGRPSWLGLVFKTSEIKTLWPWLPLRRQAAPRRRTGLKPRLRAAIEGIVNQHYVAVERALERDELPPPFPTSVQIAAKLSTPERVVKDRTVRDNVLKIMSGKDALDPKGAN